MLLLRKRFSKTSPHSLQPVPSRDRGDLGIEAFSLDGFVYQCYAAEEPLTVRALYEKQRDKLSTDLKKLCDYSAELGRLLSGTSIRRYVFLVPRHDSRELIVHAKKKASEVSGWGLPFIDDSFEIIIETDDDYAAEREELHALPNPLLNIEPVTDDSVSTWKDHNRELRDTTTEKIEKIETASRVERVTNLIIKEFIRGENRFDVLRTKNPELYSGIRAELARQEDLLFLTHPEEDNRDIQVLLAIVKDLADRLVTDFNVNRTIADNFAWRAVADWIMRCPLDFAISGASND